MLIRRYGTSGGFLFTMMGFVGEHFIFCPAGTLALLTSDFLNLGALSSNEAILLLLNLVE